MALTVLLVGTLSIVGCGEDEPTSPDPEACNADLCATNEALRNECLEEYNRCIASGNAAEECAVFARTTCGGENVN